VQDLLDLFCTATAANVAYGLATSAKLRRVEMWADPVAGGSLVSIEDTGVGLPGVGAPSRIREDTTLGVSRPAHVVWKPAPGSLLAMWQSNESSDPILVLTSSGAGYLDLHASWIMQNGQSPVAVSGTVAGATVGQIYVRALDSLSGTSLIPVAYPTI